MFHKPLFLFFLLDFLRSKLIYNVFVSRADSKVVQKKLNFMKNEEILGMGFIITLAQNSYDIIFTKLLLKAIYFDLCHQ